MAPNLYQSAQRFLRSIRETIWPSDRESLVIPAASYGEMSARFEADIKAAIADRANESTIQFEYSTDGMPEPPPDWLVEYLRALDDRFFARVEGSKIVLHRKDATDHTQHEVRDTVKSEICRKVTGKEYRS